MDNRVRIGQNIGNIVVLEKYHKRGRFVCKCKCGTTLIMNHRDIKRKRIQVQKAGFAGCQRCAKSYYVNNRTQEELYRYVYNSYRKAAKDRNLSFQLNRIEFTKLIKRECFYCGDRDKNCRKDRLTGKLLFYNGVDRIDSNEGYTIDNVVPCCKTCNLMKSNHTLSEFLSHIYKIAKYKVQRPSLTGVDSSESKQEMPSLKIEKGNDMVSST